MKMPGNKTPPSFGGGGGPAPHMSGSLGAFKQQMGQMRGPPQGMPPQAMGGPPQGGPPMGPPQGGGQNQQGLIQALRGKMGQGGPTMPQGGPPQGMPQGGPPQGMMPPGRQRF